tara:strand:+ start:2832 stop:4034 length:1203 start_codon:yes stop_codon:yes gene_type:complete
MLSLIYFPNSNLSVSFSVVQMAQNELSLTHLYILTIGILSFICGNYIYRNFIWKKREYEMQHDLTLSSNAIMLFFIIPSFLIVMLLLYQFIVFFGGLSNIFENLSAYRTGSFGGQGSGYLIYPALIIFPSIVIYFLIDYVKSNKINPLNKNLSLILMFTALLIATSFSGFRFHIVIWVFVLLVFGIIKLGNNMKYVILLFAGTLFVLIYGIIRTFNELSINDDFLVNIPGIIIGQVNRVPNLSFIAMTELTLIPNYEILLQFFFEPFTSFFIEGLWEAPVNYMYAKDVVYEYLYLRSGNVSNLGGISTGPISFFYWMLGPIFMPIIMLIFGFLSGFSDKIIENANGKFATLHAILVSIFLFYSIENPYGALIYVLYVSVTWLFIFFVEQYLIRTIKKAKN